MGDMTAAAVFTDRRMFKQKRTALIFVATQAGVVQVQSDQFAFFQRTMRRMAISAHQLRFQQRMTAGQPRLGPHILMTLIAGLRLADPLQYPLSRRMGVVAIAAGDVLHRMSTAIPVHQVTLMTVGANRIAGFHIDELIGPESELRKLHRRIQWMLTRIAMTGSTAIPGDRRARIISNTMGGCEYAMHRR